MKKTTHGWLFALSGILSGLLLMAPHLLPLLAPLQIVALLPALAGLTSAKGGKSGILRIGVWMGVAYVAPLILAYRLPGTINLMLMAAMIFMTVLFSAGAWISMRGPAVPGAFGVGALLALLDWLQFTLLPLWGTAQSIVRPWSGYPELIQFISFTGITGIAFTIGSLQALVINLYKRPRSRAGLACGALALLLTVAALNILARRPAPSLSIKAAAIGWNSEHLEQMGGIRTEAAFDAFFAEPASRAARAGARLLVTPELGFHFGNFNFVNRGDNDWFEEGKKAWYEKFRETAVKNKLYLAIGYYDAYTTENRLLFMNPAGVVVGEYTKTHLIPFSPFKKGDGALAIIDIDGVLGASPCGVRVGGMICHDDNYTDLSREYARNRTALMATPTLDWAHIKNAHFQSSLFRPIESGYAVIRATMDGISAIISPAGEILARKDHIEEGTGLILAEIPLSPHETFFSRYGHWPVPASLLIYLFSIIWSIWGIAVRLRRSSVET